jgi:prepilin-type N-terminal cleavage/methylation domain-containing protein
MSGKQGFTLIEVVVAALIGVTVVLFAGLLGSNLVHQRTSSDSSSAAMAIAERTMEKLQGIPFSEVAGSLYVTRMSAGLHGPPVGPGTSCVSPPCPVDGTGEPSVGPYLLRWNVTNNGLTGSRPLVTPLNDSKQITVTVTHATNPNVRANLVSYFKSW